MEISAQFSLPGERPRLDQRLADQVEAMFLQEMLKAGGIENTGTTMSGGIGEEQFASFLTAEYARILASRIDLGLSGKSAP